ncbi:hypothetical protein [Vibrio coralliilyticus]|uniref:Uncharacterized protein n=1 Tax=Vibrio coralliilyticus TaxID=190893 RepID=A0AAP6ZNF4_9VIBR|nr:hypothetical protein [Vibrio coralliilyticus]NOI31807.1 hypothetical protein [Vibrio coralliilyticus]NOJ25250.1 hypothetical protein [Vibrio coralliilyticus]
MSDIKQEIEKGIELLWLCQKLQSEKDGIERPTHSLLDKSKTLDQFSKDVSRSATNMAALYKLFPMEDRLSTIGLKLEKKGLIKVGYGESYAEGALAYIESNL